MIMMAITIAMKSGACERGAAGGAAPGTGGLAMWWPCPRVQLHPNGDRLVLPICAGRSAWCFRRHWSKSTAVREPSCRIFAKIHRFQQLARGRTTCTNRYRFVQVVLPGAFAGTG